MSHDEALANAIENMRTALLNVSADIQELTAAVLKVREELKQLHTEK